MFDTRDPLFRAVNSHPHRGPPLLIQGRVVFLDDLRISFGRYDAFDARNPEFAATPAAPPLHPPRMLPDGTISCTRSPPVTANLQASTIKHAK
jgi:hypothetical protein